jgi:hypothetical protein
MKLTPVEGHPHLFRDENSKGVINTSKEQLNEARRIKEIAQRGKSKIDLIEKKLNTLEEKFDLILKHLEKK